MNIHIINGPNLNMLGQREPDIYGSISWDDVEAAIKEKAKALAVSTVFFQSNHEGALIDYIQKLTATRDSLIINAGGLTHTSIALGDALAIFKGYKIELHISNVFAREAFRHQSFISANVHAIVCGLGWQGYLWALEALHKTLLGNC